jgi:propanediol utilization protein
MITVDKDNSDALVVETVCDLLELLARNKIWVRVDEDTSLSKFIDTDKAEKDAFQERNERRNERWQ